MRIHLEFLSLFKWMAGINLPHLFLFTYKTITPSEGRRMVYVVLNNESTTTRKELKLSLREGWSHREKSMLKKHIIIVLVFFPKGSFLLNFSYNENSAQRLLIRPTELFICSFTTFRNKKTTFNRLCSDMLPPKFTSLPDRSVCQMRVELQVNALVFNIHAFLFLVYDAA